MLYRKFALLSVVATSFVAACSDAPLASGDKGGSKEQGGDETGGTSGGAKGGNGGNGGKSTPSGGGGGGTTTQGGTCADDAIEANEKNNYSFSSTLKLDLVKVKANSEVAFDWSGLTKSFLNVDVDPKADVDMVTVILWKLTPSELEKRMNDDALAMSDAAAPAAIYTEQQMSSGTINDLKAIGGFEIKPSDLADYFDDTKFDPAKHTYTASPAKGIKPGKGTHMSKAFQLDPDESETKVVIDNKSTSMTLDAKFSELEPTYVPKGKAEITVDWENMKTNAMGHEWGKTYIDNVLVASLKMTPAEMEEKFLDLLDMDKVADGVWRGRVPSGSSIDLASLANNDGDAFAGIDDDSDKTWIMALMCTESCNNPAPWYITILKPCSK